MKNLKKTNKFKLEHFEVAKLKNANLINGGGGDVDTGTGTKSDQKDCPNQAPQKPQNPKPPKIDGII